jgi:hypothetical protein
MKFIITILTLLTIYNNASAQNVGIGITTPDEKLQVDSVIRIGKNAIITAGSTRKNTIKFGDGNFATIGEQDKDDRLVLNAGSFTFKTGKIGIGIDSAREMLDVNGGVIIGNTITNNLGAIKYTVADSSFQGFDNTRWKSLINNFEIVGEDAANLPSSFSSNSRNQYLPIPGYNYTIPKSGNYLVLLYARGTGFAENNNLNSFTDDRVDISGEIRLNDVSNVFFPFITKDFFYIKNVPGSAGSNPPTLYFNDDGEKSTIRYFTAGTTLGLTALVQTLIGPDAPAQVNAWNVKLLVKFILLN